MPVKNLDKTFADLSKALPGYEFIKVVDQGTYIDNAIGEVKDTLILGILLAVLVLYVFLRRIGTTMVISVAIPVSIIATFNLMYFNHLTLNIMTLGGLALGAGMLVDNAIVVLEKYYPPQGGRDVPEGSGNYWNRPGRGSHHLLDSYNNRSVPPIVYLHGASSEMFRDQAWTVAFALLSSLFVAMLVIPMLISTLFPEKGKKAVSTTALQFKGYKGFLEKILENAGL